MSPPSRPSHATLALAGVAGAVCVFGFQALGTSQLVAAALVALLVLLPVLSVVQVRMLEDAALERMPAYVSSILSLGVLGAAAWWVGTREGGAAAMGLQSVEWAPFFLWTGVLVIAGLAVTAVFRTLGQALGLREAPLLEELLPRTPRERVTFGVLSLAAGAGEELAYRGLVIGALSGPLGVVWAAVVSSVVFGVLHVYQGALGMVRTGFLGGLLAWGYLAGGSLWAPMAAHTLLDILLGIFLAERMMVPRQSSGVSELEAG